MRTSKFKKIQYVRTDQWSCTSQRTHQLWCILMNKTSDTVSSCASIASTLAFWSVQLIQIYFPSVGSCFL